MRHMLQFFEDGWSLEVICEQDSDFWRSMDDRAKMAHAHVAPVQAHTSDRGDMLEAMVYQLSEQNGALVCELGGSGRGIVSELNLLSRPAAASRGPGQSSGKCVVSLVHNSGRSAVGPTYRSSPCGNRGMT